VKTNYIIYYSLLLFFLRLEEKFNEYKDQLKKDVCGIISHDDDDLSKTKREKQSPNGSKDRTNSEADTVIHQVMFCLQPAVRSNITVFNLNSDSYLSETIFRSICRGELVYFKDLLIIQIYTFQHVKDF